MENQLLQYFNTNIDYSLSSSKLSEDNISELVTFCSKQSDFIQLISGSMPTLPFINELIFSLPEELSPKKKYVIGFRNTQNELVSVLDFLIDYPKANICCVGLLMVDPAYRRQKLATAIMESMEKFLFLNMNIVAITLVVQKQNKPAIEFWTNRNYVLEDTLKRSLGGLKSEIFKFTKRKQQ